MLKTDFHWVKDFFGIHEDEVWENGLFILQRKQALIDVAKKQNWTIAESERTFRPRQKHTFLHNELRERGLSSIQNH